VDLWKTKPPELLQRSPKEDNGIGVQMDVPDVVRSSGHEVVEESGEGEDVAICERILCRGRYEERRKRLEQGSTERLETE